MKTKDIRSNDVRLPAPERGNATRVLRYRREHAVILHPDDYREFQALEELVDEACRLDPLPISDIGEAAHLEEDRPGTSIEEPEALARLLAE